MAIRRATGVETIRVGKDLRIAVGRSKNDCQYFALPNAFSAKDDVFQRGKRVGSLGRRTVAEALFDG